MLIQLRQSEIEDAVKMYVAAQGINLTGKKVDMNFTAGRGSAGITVDLDIVDAKLSELTKPTPRASFPAPESRTSGEANIPAETQAPEAVTGADNEDQEAAPVDDIPATNQETSRPSPLFG